MRLALPGWNDVQCLAHQATMVQPVGRPLRPSGVDCDDVQLDLCPPRA